MRKKQRLVFALALLAFGLWSAGLVGAQGRDSALGTILPAAPTAGTGREGGEGERRFRAGRAGLSEPCGSGSLRRPVDESGRRSEGAHCGGMEHDCFELPDHRKCTETRKNERDHHQNGRFRWLGPWPAARCKGSCSQGQKADRRPRQPRFDQVGRVGGDSRRNGRINKPFGRNGKNPLAAAKIDLPTESFDKVKEITSGILQNVSTTAKLLIAEQQRASKLLEENLKVSVPIEVAENKLRGETFKKTEPSFFSRVFYAQFDSSLWPTTLKNIADSLKAEEDSFNKPCVGRSLKDFHHTLHRPAGVGSPQAQGGNGRAERFSRSSVGTGHLYGGDPRRLHRL